jgi:hypothetical protein
MRTTTSQTKSFQIAKTVARYASAKMKVQFDDMLSYLLDKIENCERNFNPGTGVSYEKYLNVNLRLYSLNYLRDQKNANAITLSSADLALVQRANRYPNYQIASSRLNVPAATLEQLSRAAKMAQSNHMKGEQALLLVPAGETEENDYVNFIAKYGLAWLVGKTPQEIKAEFYAFTA